MRLSGWQLPTEHLSATALTRAIQCPEQFRQKHLLKTPEPMNQAKFLGIVDHAAHEENFRQKIDTREDLDVQWMRGIYRAKWDLTLEKEGEPERWDGEPSDLQQHGLLMMETYLTHATPKVQPTVVEERFDITVPGVPVPIIGYIDVMTHDRIVERKTSAKKITKPKPQWRLQGRIYQLATGYPTEWHIITKQATPMVYTADEEPRLFLPNGNADETVTLIAQTAERLNDLYARYGPDRPWPTEGIFHDWLCDYCAYGPKSASSCPAWRNL